MRLSILIALGIGLAWTSVVTQARETRRLSPSTKWVVDYSVDSCRLMRRFGEDDRHILLILDQFAPGDWFRMMFVGKSIKPRSEARPEAVLRFGPNEPEFEVAGFSGTTGNLPTFIVSGMQRLAPLTEAEQHASQAARARRIHFDAAPIGPTREQSATWLELRKLLRFDVIFETGRMDRPLAALRGCSWDLVKTWGLDVEQQKNLIRKPFPKNSDWFRSSDYPDEMLRGGHQGIVNFRLMVDENGKPTSCHIQTSTRPKAFDDVVCRRVMARAEFEPGLDAQGRPVRSFWQQTVTFRME